MRSRRSFRSFVVRCLVLSPVALILSANAGIVRAAAPPRAAPARAIQFAPQGIVKGVRQATARFPDPMIRLGDPRAAASPFDVDCSETGTARWIDTRTWAYDFARDLPAGVHCVFRLRADARTLAGAPLGTSQTFELSTGGPAIVRTVPFEGATDITEDQAFVLVLDADTDPTSILDHVSFAVEGVRERIGVRLIDGEERDAVLHEYRWIAKPPVIVVQGTQRFPNGARVSLVWGKGVATPSGVPSAADQRLDFRTRPPFTATFRCDREGRGAACIPVTPMRVELSTSIPLARAAAIKLVDADGRERPREPPPTDEESVSTIVFPGPFAESATFTVVVPPDLADDSGRSPVNAARYPLTVKTGTAPPLAKFAARFGIIESKADPTLPVTLRNLEPQAQARLLEVGVKGSMYRVPAERDEEILPWLRRVGFARRARSVFATADPALPSTGAAPAATPAPAPTGGVRTFTLPKPGGERAFEVVGIPFTEPGLYVVELESARLGASLLGKAEPMYVPTAALVTNLSVHLEWGEHGSLAWVTTLDDATPVAGADVTVRDCRSAVLWRGVTDAEGIARIDGLPSPGAVATCYGPDGSPDAEPFDGSQTRALRDLFGGVLVVARTAEDLGFVHSSWNQGIESWRYDLPEAMPGGRTTAHTILDRPLFRAGDTVHMKHVLRDQTLHGFAVPPADRRPVTLAIRHAGSGEHHELPLVWDDRGIAETTWTIPREARLGRYEIHLLGRESAAAAQASGAATPSAEGDEPDEASGPDDWLGGELRVEEFRVPLMRGSVLLPATPQVRVKDVTADLAVQYLAGGSAAGLPVTLRAQIGPKTMTAPPELEDFTIANGAVVEGTVRPESNGDAADDRPRIHQRQQLTLDAIGTARATISDLPAAATPQELRAELEFRDPSGQAQTVTSTIPLWPGDRLVAIAPERWAATRERVGTRIAVIDVAGAPVSGAPVVVDAFARKVYSHRKRLVGGFYGYDHVEETRRLGAFCTGTTDVHGLFWCEGASPVEGQIVLQASVTDGAGNTTSAHAEVFVPGERDFWFRAEDSDRIDVLPERRHYEPGETARFQVRMPFRAATALVAVEREGIASAHVVELSGDEPVVELPVDASWAPNVYVSVLAVRGRVGDVQPTALVDLGKPAFKLGIAQIEVGWRAHQLAVRVAAERPVYRVRERASVKIAVRTPEGAPPPEGAEVAVAAVDEGLLELLPNRSWNLLAAMMGERAYGVETSTAQMQVVGRRHFGLKAMSPGGGGGRQPTRELFDTLLFWQGRVPLDGRGRATVEVPLNDSLTSFRVVAVATGGLETFGTGATTIRSTQDVMILPGIPPVVREGDRFHAEVTVRNTTTRALDLTVTPRVEGLPSALAPEVVPLPAGAAKVVGWDVTVPSGIESLRWNVEAARGDGTADRVTVAQTVRPAVPVRTLQATLVQIEPGGAAVPVARPADALADRGAVQVALSPSLTAGLEGVREWMRRYPYGCLEQRVSRAVALRDAALWHDVAAALPAYVDGDGLLKFFPNLERGSEVLTAYILAVTREAGLDLPQRVRESMEHALHEFVAGSIVPDAPLATADLAIRKLATLEALSRAGGGVDIAQLGSITIEPALWPTSAVLDWWSILQRVPNAPDRARRLAEAEAILRARLTWSGTTIGFSTESNDELWWLMAGPDANAARLVLAALEHGVWRDELPRLARGVVAREHGGAWATTVANAWGVLALEKFARAFESEPVTGTTTATLAGVSQALDWSSDGGGGHLVLPWPQSGAGELALDHAGAGQPWAAIEARAALPLRAPLASGYTITRTVTPLEARDPGRMSRGDVLRVRLEIVAESDMTWVVVSDPIPAGASHVATGLGGDAMAAQGGRADADGPEPAFTERGFEAFRAYYELVPRGRVVVEYAIRLEQSGRFVMPPTRVEALYAPEMFGELPSEPIEVAP